MHQIDHHRSHPNKATTTTMGRHAFQPTSTSLLLLAVLGGTAAWSANILPSRFVSISRSSRGSTLHAAKESSIDESTADRSPSIPPSSSRRAFLCQDAPTAIGAASFLSCLLGDAGSSVAAEEGEEDLIDVYFGCGCFWHVQHEFVEAERSLLSRPDASLTSRAGYAGGKAGSLNGKVCYHNAANISDYGKLGHAEVVSLRIPPSKFEDFAVEYCKLFDEKGFRPDQFGDRGGEYRNLVGVPGGSKSRYAELLIRASKRTGDKLDFAVGKGDDGDAAKVVFVMDTKEFPFFKAENYHQFHDGFNWGEDYSREYNGLAGMFKKMGEDFGDCPNGMVGLGVGGL